MVGSKKKFSELSQEEKLNVINKQLQRGNALQATQTVITLLVFIGILSLPDLIAKAKKIAQ